MPGIPLHCHLSSSLIPDLCSPLTPKTPHLTHRRSIPLFHSSDCDFLPSLIIPLHDHLLPRAAD